MALKNNEQPQKEENKNKRKWADKLINRRVDEDKKTKTEKTLTLIT